MGGNNFIVKPSYWLVTIDDLIPSQHILSDIALSLPDTVQGHSTHNGLYGHGRIGILANHTYTTCIPHMVYICGICIPHMPHALSSFKSWRLCHGCASSVSGRRFPKFSNQPYQPTNSNFLGRPFGKLSKKLTTLFRALGSDNGSGYTIFLETSHIALFAWTLLKLDVLMGVGYLVIQVEISFLRPCYTCTSIPCNMVFSHTQIQYCRFRCGSTFRKGCSSTPMWKTPTYTKEKIFL